jgi:penicillin-binding protein 1C
LGNGDVTLIELANGYRALANGGVWRPWTWRPALGGVAGLQGGGRSAGAVSAESHRVVSPVASAIVLDILRDPSARIPGFGTSTPFDFPFPVAVKTGTSRHFTDNWAVGATQGFTVAVWAGNFSGRPMQGVSGVTGAGPLLHRVVMVVSRRIPPGSLTTPAEAGAVGVPVCRLSGMLATPACAQLTEWFARGSAPMRADDWERDGHVTLPDEYAEWARHGLQPALEGVTLAMASAGTQLIPSPAAAPDEPRAHRAAATAATEPRAARFAIMSPLDGDRYAVPSGVEAQYATIALQARGMGAHAVRWLVDGKAFHGGRWTLSPGAHVFRAISQRGDTAEARIAVER